MNRLLSFQSRCMQSVIRLNEAVVAIIAAVDNIDRLRLRIAEDKEIVVQEVHLHDGFLDIHRLDDEVFRLDDLIGIALIVYIRQRARLELLRLELTGTQSAREFRLLFMDLTLEFLDDKVDGRVHIHRRLLAAQQDATGDRDSDFYDVTTLRDGQQNLDVADGLKVFRDFANAFLPGKEPDGKPAPMDAFFCVFLFSCFSSGISADPYILHRHM